LSMLVLHIPYMTLYRSWIFKRGQFKVGESNIFLFLKLLICLICFNGCCDSTSFPVEHVHSQMKLIMKARTLVNKRRAFIVYLDVLFAMKASIMAIVTIVSALDKNGNPTISDVSPDANDPVTAPSEKKA